MLMKWNIKDFMYFVVHIQRLDEVEIRWHLKLYIKSTTSNYASQGRFMCKRTLSIRLQALM